MAEEIALFIDFENIRYSMLNTQHREPDPQELINVARRYGTVMVAKAYADWTRQPEMFKGSLMAAMIDRVDCPAKQRDRYRGAGWQQNSTTYNNWSTARDEAGQAQSWNANANAAVAQDDEDDEELNDTVIDDQDDVEEEEEERGEAMNEPSASFVRGPAPNQSWNNPALQPPQYGSQSTVDLNMLMDIIETVFDRPTISTFVLMTGDRDFTRICARLKLRLNKFVVVAGVPGTVSRDLTAAANQFVLIGNHTSYSNYPAHTVPSIGQPMLGLAPTDPQFLQFLDYIDRHWAWRTIIGVSNFIGDPYNHKNRFRGRLTRETARELLQTCVQQGILTLSTDEMGNEDLRLNRANSTVEAILASTQQMSGPSQSQSGGQQLGPGPYSQMGPWTQSYNGASVYVRRSSPTISGEEPQDEELDEEEMELEEGGEDEEE